MSEGQSRFDQLGGEWALRPIIDDFVDRAFDDAMIGFFFAKASRQRIKDKEYEHAAEFLGAPLKYSGRPIRSAHAPHPIMGGQFMRRRQLLAETLTAHNVPDNIANAWLAHVDALKNEVTKDAIDECDEYTASRRISDETGDGSESEES